MSVSIIVATSENGVIGRDGGLPWRLPADLKRFKQLTMGHLLVVGRLTFELIGKPLPGRRMVVVTSQRDYAPDGVETASSVEAAIAMARDDEEVFLGGGASIHAEGMALADRIHLTLVRAQVEGDVYFPDLELEGWTEVSRIEHPADDRHEYDFEFKVLERDAVLQD